MSIYVNNEGDGGGGTGLSDLPPQLIALADYGVTAGPTTALGGAQFYPTGYAIPGKTLSVHLVVTTRVSRVGLTGSVTLYNVTDGEDAVFVGSITETGFIGRTVAVDLADPNKVYELRAAVAGAVDEADYMVVMGAALRLVWS